MDSEARTYRRHFPVLDHRSPAHWCAAQSIATPDVFMAVVTQPIHDMGLVMDVARGLELGLTTAVAQALAARRRSPYASEFPLVVQGEGMNLHGVITHLISGFCLCLQSFDRRPPASPALPHPPTVAAPLVSRACTNTARMCSATPVSPPSNHVSSLTPGRERPESAPGAAAGPDAGAPPLPTHRRRTAR